MFGGRARFTPSDPETCARVLYGYMTERFPQLRGTRVTHGWTGNTAFTFDALPHMGEEGGLHYALGCNGSGVAMMTYLGTQTARKIARVANAPCAFDTPDFPDHRLYTGNPWFLPVGRRLVPDARPARPDARVSENATLSCDQRERGLRASPAPCPSPRIAGSGNLVAMPCDIAARLTRMEPQLSLSPRGGGVSG